MNQSLFNSGWSLETQVIRDEAIEGLKTTIFDFEGAGMRCLLDVPLVREAVLQTRQCLRDRGILPAEAVAIQAIAFDKTATTNWKVTWHQDLMFPFAALPQATGYELGTVKHEVAFARPPREVLEQLLAVRLHLDECDAENGPLRVSPGTHRLGVIASRDIHDIVVRHGEQTCLAPHGSAVLMRPLTLHASSQATQPRHRRVLHLVFHTGGKLPERWHRAV